jgi:hypothetical protein
MLEKPKNRPPEPRLIFSSSVIPAKAGIQFLSIAVVGKMLPKAETLRNSGY